MPTKEKERFEDGKQKAVLMCTTMTGQVREEMSYDSGRIMLNNAAKQARKCGRLSEEMCA